MADETPVVTPENADAIRAQLAEMEQQQAEERRAAAVAALQPLYDLVGDDFVARVEALGAAAAGAGEKHGQRFGFFQTTALNLRKQVVREAQALGMVAPEPVTPPSGMPEA